MSDVAKCALCRKEPMNIRGLAGSKTDTYRCSDDECLQTQIGVMLRLKHWNETQARILAARRKDFEAGAYFARHQEMGSGNPDWSQVRADYNSAFLDFSDDDVDDYPEINAFDDYIKEGA